MAVSTELNDFKRVWSIDEPRQRRLILLYLHMKRKKIRENLLENSHTVQDYLNDEHEKKKLTDKYRHRKRKRLKWMLHKDRLVFRAVISLMPNNV